MPSGPQFAVTKGFKHVEAIIKYLIILVGVVLVQGCATKYQETTDWELKGGYFERKIAAGLYRVTGKTDVKSWLSYSEARRIFNKRAAELCSDKGYILIDQRESSLRDEPIGNSVILSEGAYMPIKGPGMTVATVEGEILCKGGALTPEEAKRFIENNVN
ncbi:hypothetical protein [Microbulbifer spongiae]|uniref:Lipoprotein n=1 Tax=Microbulbifer spongiae TaxID=2944933 RepID=A0ABY9E8E2_9GAMM|nr:hypothetical protein [Microbulbifer sp. MI-G]WKD48942.1 hypothetical protein M8T91_13710 [Microbulbifer sp. MI-G]